MRFAPFIALGFLALAACGVASEEPNDNASSDVMAASDAGSVAENDISGIYFGRVGNDSSYLELTQSGGTVTGTACERPGHDCYPLVNGTIVNGRFTASYSWIENGRTETIAIDLIPDAVPGPSRLIGTYKASKCNCTLQASLNHYADASHLPIWD
jgi:hypothetical protein